MAVELPMCLRRSGPRRRTDEKKGSECASIVRAVYHYGDGCSVQQRGVAECGVVCAAKCVAFAGACLRTTLSATARPSATTFMRLNEVTLETRPHEIQFSMVLNHVVKLKGSTSHLARGAEGGCRVGSGGRRGRAGPRVSWGGVRM